MSAHLVVADVFLGAAIVTELICVAGFCWMRDVFDKLHFAAASTTLGPALLAVAVILVGFSSSSATIEIVVALAALTMLNPVLTHATARLASEFEADEREELRGITVADVRKTI